MAYATQTRSGADLLKLEISSAVYHALQRLDDYRAYRRTISELSRLNAHQLADLGLHRSEIARVAREAVYGPRA